MKHLIRIAMFVIVLATLVLVPGQTPAAAQGPGYVYLPGFPTSAPNDAKFLALSGKPLKTLAGAVLHFEFAVPSTNGPTFQIGIFDGDTGKDNTGAVNPAGGNWDLGTSQLIFSLYNDPHGDGTGSTTGTLVGQWKGNDSNPLSGSGWSISSAAMPNNDWWTLTVQLSPAAQAPSGNYFYTLEVQLEDPNSNTESPFKIRSTVDLSVFQSDVIGFVGAARQIANDGRVIYPAWDGATLPTPDFFLTTPTTYDGNWTFHLDVPVSISSITIYDGDFDVGTVNNPRQTGYPSGVALTQCQNTLAPYTETGYFPPWATGTDAIPADGQSGSPADDNYFDFFRRTPCVYYQVVDRQGRVYVNDNPSGNQQWEQFPISAPPLQPAGFWKVEVKGLDLANLSFFRFPHAVVGTCEDGTPCFPRPKPYLVGDTVWYDTNGNGVQDGGELGIANVKVNLLDVNNLVLATTTTNASGYYQFEVWPGTYTVQVDSTNFDSGNPLYGLAATTASPTQTNTVTNANVMTYDFGYRGSASLGDFVWRDLNANGVQDSGEPGISGVTVNLLNSSGTVIGTTTTDANGAYGFTGLVPGTYAVQFVAPSGYVFSPQGQGGDATKDSNPDTSTGRTANVTLAVGENNPTIDAGLYQPAALGDFVWKDLNANGVQDSGEPGIAGVTVNLLNSGGTVIATTTTDANGLYKFENLAPGTYAVQFVKPAGYNPSPQYQGGDAAKDSNANTTTGRTDAVTLNAGDNNITIDAGFYPLGSLGDFVWRDLNANGIQDSGEPGISGVTVQLFGSDGTTLLATTTTDANGAYRFDNLTAGTYYVQFAPPPGSVFTTKNASGSTAANDSNANTSTGRTDAITLGVGESNMTIDAGVLQFASLGDFVWEDTNKNGLQDSGEPGVAGVTVRLLGSDGSTVLATTTTDATGKYLFSNLAPGTYSVQFVLPSGYMFTFRDANGNANDTTDSDANRITGGTDSVTLTAGQSNLTLDAGLIKPTTLVCANNMVLNPSFELNSGTPPLNWTNGYAGITGALPPDGVNIGYINGTAVMYQNVNVTTGYGYTLTFYSGSEAPLNQTVTLQYYNASNVAIGTPSVHTITTNLSGGVFGGPFTLTLSAAPADAKYLRISVTANNDGYAKVDAFCLQAQPPPATAALGDFVWNDKNHNGIQDSGEPGISGVTVKLLGSDGTTVLATTTTDANGKYAFTNLAAGTYSVQFVAPSGYTFTTKNASGSTAANDSNADTTTGKTANVTLTAGQVDNTIDAGLWQPASLGDFVWEDKNGNGIQDSGEPGISGVTVKLLASNGFTVLATTTTDANGKYLFSNLTAGTYYVLFVKPNGYVFTTANVGSNDAIDSDAHAIFGRSGAIALAAGQSNLTVDAGLKKPTASLGDFVWEDKDGDGKQDSGEPGIAGVTVKLLGSDGTTVLATTTTDANGKYLFNNLAAGTYYVQFVAPTGYTFTTANVGSNDAIDSDANATTGKTGAIALAAGQNNLTIDAGLKKTTSWVCANNLVLNPSFELNTGSPPTNWTNGTAGNIGVYVDGKNVGYISGSGVMYQNVNVTPGYSYTLTFYSGSHNPKNQTVKLQYYNASNAAIGTPAVHTITSKLSTGFGGPYTLTLGGAPADAKYLRISVSANGYDYAKVDAFCLQAQPGTPPQTASLGDFVWKDLNGNGIQDSGEPGVAGVTVKLLGSDGTTVLATTTTDASGKYLFNNLAAGTYSVQFVAPTGYTFTTANVGSNDAIDSDANATTGKTTAVTLAAGQSNLTVDAGLKSTTPPATASLGDYVWEDKDGDGIQDSGEPGIAGVTVKLLKSDGTTVLATTTTDANGKYLFNNLAAGTYYVQFVKPAGYTGFTTANAGSDDAKDSDADANGKTGAINLAAGQNNLTIDAGLKKAASWVCANNLVLNPSFELNTGSPPTNWTNGTAGNIGVYVDGKNVGYINGSGVMYQNVNVTPGYSYTLTFYSGSHNPKNQTVKLQYYNASNAAIGTPAVHTITSKLSTGFGGPYTLTLGGAPADAKYLRISVSANGYDYAKVDALCLQAQPGTPPPSAPGTGTPGYWMNHPDAWPSNSIVIGGVTYSKTDAINLMKKPTSTDMTYQMFQHLVAAKLNVAVGNTASCINSGITAADNWMKDHKVGSGVAASSPAWQSISATFTALDNYNNGKLCAPARN